MGNMGALLSDAKTSQRQSEVHCHGAFAVVPVTKLRTDTDYRLP